MKTGVLGCFDAAFVINADHHADRLTTATKELCRIGVSFERYPAITKIEEPTPLRPGELATTLSHCGVVKLAKDRGYHRVLIFEDDVIFRPDFVKRWSEIEDKVRTCSFDLFYLFDWHADQKEEMSSLKQISGTVCCHAYSVSAMFYDAYLDNVHRHRHLGAIDQLLLRLVATKWATTPNLAGQAAGVSTTYDRPFPLRWSAHDG